MALHVQPFVFVIAMDPSCMLNLVATIVLICLGCVAICGACVFLDKVGFQLIIFETDCPNATTFIINTTSPVHWSTSQLVEEIKYYWLLWPKWRFKNILKNANFAARIFNFLIIFFFFWLFLLMTCQTLIFVIEISPLLTFFSFKLNDICLFIKKTKKKRIWKIIPFT